MCFSATASFASGLTLLPAGAYALTAALRKDRAYLPFAAAPVAFGVQQLCEGGVWLGLDRGEPRLVEAGALGFLFFAIVFWPGWVPFGAAVLEGPGWKRRGFLLLAAAGLLVGAVGYVPSAGRIGTWLRVGVAHHSIHYTLGPPGMQDLSEVGVAVYLAAVWVPLLASRVVRLRLLGGTLVVAAAATYLVSRYAFISVWCFFAALLSFQICATLYLLPVPAAGGGSGGRAVRRSAGGRDGHDGEGGEEEDQ